jgi:hypothetical protein
VYERSETLLNFSPCSTLHLTFSTSKRLTFTKPTCTRRSSGHCLGTFVAANLNLCSPPPVKSSAYRYSPHFLFSLSPSASKGNAILCVPKSSLRFSDQNFVCISLSCMLYA